MSSPEDACKTIVYTDDGTEKTIKHLSENRSTKFRNSIKIRSLIINRETKRYFLTKIKFKTRDYHFYFRFTMNHKDYCGGKFIMKISSKYGTAVCEEGDIFEIPITDKLIEDIFRDLKIHKGSNTLYKFLLKKLNKYIGKTYCGYIMEPSHF